MKLHKLYLVANVSGTTEPEDADAYLESVSAALAGGIRLVQFRAKQFPAAVQWELGAQIAAFCAAYNATLIVNDRADLALALDAAGVHLPATGMPVSAARRLMEWRFVGVSCHSVAEAIRAEEDGADYVTLSPIFPTASKPGYGPPLGLHQLKTAAHALKIPVFALGGISDENKQDCLEAGAWGVASTRASGLIKNVFD